MPKMLGRLRRDIAAALSVATTSLAQVSDNPTYFPPDDTHPNGHILSTGGYHNAAAWPALNALAMAYADLVTLCDRMVARLLDGATSGLPDQLSDGSAHPALLWYPRLCRRGLWRGSAAGGTGGADAGSESGGFVQNDLAVPTNIAWDGQETAGRMLDYALASVALVASQALHVTNRRRRPPRRRTSRRSGLAAPPLTTIAPLGPPPRKSPAGSEAKSIMGRSPAWRREGIAPHSVGPPAVSHRDQRQTRLACRKSRPPAACRCRRRPDCEAGLPRHHRSATRPAIGTPASGGSKKCETRRSPTVSTSRTAASRSHRCRRPRDGRQRRRDRSRSRASTVTPASARGAAEPQSRLSGAVSGRRQISQPATNEATTRNTAPIPIAA